MKHIRVVAILFNKYRHLIGDRSLVFYTFKCYPHANNRTLGSLEIFRGSRVGSEEGCGGGDATRRGGCGRRVESERAFEGSPVTGSASFPEEPRQSPARAFPEGSRELERGRGQRQERDDADDHAELGGVHHRGRKGRPPHQHDGIRKCAIDFWKNTQRQEVFLQTFAS